jgi:hypothetical protein
MVCRQCGTEIADKAIICYRCGAATTDPVVKPPARRAGGSRGPVLLALLVLVAAALVMGQMSAPGAPREAGYAIAALGAVALAWQFFARRRR